MNSVLLSFLSHPVYKAAQGLTFLSILLINSQRVLLYSLITSPPFLSVIISHYFLIFHTFPCDFSNLKNCTQKNTAQFFLKIIK